MKLSVWNTTGKGRSHLTLDYVLSKYRALGHKPARLNCHCCYDCERCKRTLVDDLRTEASFEQRCKGRP